MASVAATFLREHLEGRGSGRSLEELERDPGDRLRRRISAVNTAFTNADRAFVTAADLMEELRRDLASQEAAHRELVAEAQRQRRLIDMDREEAEAVQALILGRREADDRRQRRREWMFFAAGLLLAVPINILSNIIGPR